MGGPAVFNIREPIGPEGIAHSFRVVRHLRGHLVRHLCLEFRVLLSGQHRLGVLVVLVRHLFQVVRAFLRVQVGRLGLGVPWVLGDRRWTATRFQVGLVDLWLLAFRCCQVGLGDQVSHWFLAEHLFRCLRSDLVFHRVPLDQVVRLVQLLTHMGIVEGSSQLG